MYLIEINGKEYCEREDERTKEVSLIDLKAEDVTKAEIARTEGDMVIFFGGNLADVMRWADSYNITRVFNGVTLRFIRR